MEEKQANPLSRDQLPDDVFAKKNNYIREDPEEALRRALKPSKVIPIRDDLPASRRRSAMWTVPFRGLSFDHRLKRMQTSENTFQSLNSLVPIPAAAPEVPEGMSKPPIPIAIPPVQRINALTEKNLRLVMSKREYDMFVNTWVEWLTAHPEWDQPEDIDDITQICMETVIMFRLQNAQSFKPNLDISEPFNQSFKRKQTARQNLTARRVDRVGTKANGGSTTNIAVIAGNITPEMEAERRRARKKDETDQIEFINGTLVTSDVVIETQPKE